MRVRTLAAVAAAVLMLPSVMPAQSLGEAAAREKARREKQKTTPTPAKVMTDEDLRKARGGQVSEFVTTSTSGGTTGTPAPAGTEGKAVPGPGGTAAAEGAKPKTEDELRAEAQALWRKQLETAQGDVTRMQAEVDRLQLALNDNTASQYGAGRAQTASRLEEAKNVLAQAQAQVTTLQDQGRRAGYR